MASSRSSGDRASAAAATCRLRRPSGRIASGGFAVLKTRVPEGNPSHGDRRRRAIGSYHRVRRRARAEGRRATMPHHSRKCPPASLREFLCRTRSAAGAQWTCPISRPVPPRKNRHRSPQLFPRLAEQLKIVHGTDIAGCGQTACSTSWMRCRECNSREKRSFSSGQRPWMDVGHGLRAARPHLLRHDMVEGIEHDVGEELAREIADR